MTSFNHYALGSVCAFLHKYVGGLSALEPGWKSALVSPRPGGTIRSAQTRFESRYGWYGVGWSIEEGVWKVEVKVPPNGKARVLLEGKETVDCWVGSGLYMFEVPWEQDQRWEGVEVIQGAQGNEVESHFVP